MKSSILKQAIALAAAASSGAALADAALPIVASCTMQQGSANRIVTIQ